MPGRGASRKKFVGNVFVDRAAPIVDDLDCHANKIDAKPAVRNIVPALRFSIFVFRSILKSIEAPFAQTRISGVWEAASLYGKHSMERFPYSRQCANRAPQKMPPQMPVYFL
ncbi:hypothetical protein A33K_17735 [Burkholderia humptydooensis MSMB43]|uniref:Uncharacterized protein n=1 Tax=Burkholderia humptydooensis MSMB43 TaxID=441157 RepID=A0ABN0G0G7_9BURK|nr:hypothetical protein A33K_17735 [Burkholderia humptydooensis MSMB43]